MEVVLDKLLGFYQLPADDKHVPDKQTQESVLY